MTMPGESFWQQMIEWWEQEFPDQFRTSRNEEDFGTQSRPQPRSDWTRPRMYANPHAYDIAVTPEGEVYQWDSHRGDFIKRLKHTEKTADNDDNALEGTVIEGDWSRTR